ncbi:aminopeptidase P family protein [Marinitoga sp. 38H-ov]|uniref:M24 family metallopeptidase n=1 Tax=Marinitoga sp. 38H-ov TaxID=1755814 RepID=UPI0013ECDA1C|nr:aminopeptidase P family protein [Marinitoga sp. 38H-ov]KAF2956771.1 hypothetical protein AS160_04190 [Marinitoga sp. 38H-ov]
MKIKKIRELLREEGLEGIWLKNNINFSWIFNGRGWISISNEKASGSLLITKNDIYFITNNIEEKRLINEEITKDFELKIISHMWYEKDIDIVKDIVSLDKLGTDINIGNNIEEQIKLIRMEFEDIERYKNDGKTVMEIFESTLLNITPKMTELEVAGNVYRDLQKEGFTSYVILVFSDNSRKEYRHNLPRRIKIGDKGFVSICTTNGGPIISLTRAFSFSNDIDYIKQHELNAKLEAMIINETKPGKTMSYMFKKIKELYTKLGYEKEFYMHHQGGIIGYNTRESLALPNNEIIIKDKMAFCWNPTITGTKSEDTFILNNEKIEFISWNENSMWPKLKFNIDNNVIYRPGVMILD